MPGMQRHHVIGLCLLVLLSLSAVVHTIFFSEGWEKRQSLKEEVAERAVANDLAEKETGVFSSDRLGVSALRRGVLSVLLPGRTI